MNKTTKKTFEDKTLTFTYLSACRGKTIEKIAANHENLFIKFTDGEVVHIRHSEQHYGDGGTFILSAGIFEGGLRCTTCQLSSFKWGQFPLLAEIGLCEKGTERLHADHFAKVKADQTQAWERKNATDLLQKYPDLLADVESAAQKKIKELTETVAHLEMKLQSAMRMLQ